MPGGSGVPSLSGAPRGGASWRHWGHAGVAFEAGRRNAATWPWLPDRPAVISRRPPGNDPTAAEFWYDHPAATGVDRRLAAPALGRDLPQPLPMTTSCRPSPSRSAITAWASLWPP